MPYSKEVLKPDFQENGSQTQSALQYVEDCFRLIYVETSKRRQPDFPTNSLSSIRNTVTINYVTITALL